MPEPIFGELKQNRYLPCFEAAYGLAVMFIGMPTKPYIDATFIMFPRPSRIPRFLNMCEYCSITTSDSTELPESEVIQ
jgi:hypothetical protein